MPLYDMHPRRMSRGCSAVMHGDIMPHYMPRFALVMLRGITASVEAQITEDHSNLFLNTANLDTKRFDSHRSRYEHLVDDVDAAVIRCYISCRDFRAVYVRCPAAHVRGDTVT